MAVKPLPGAQLDRTHPLAQGLAGLWLMNEGGGLTAYDYSGNDNHGTLTNGPTWVAGPDGAALNFALDNQVVDCGNPAINYAAGFSLVARARSTGAASIQQIMARDDSIGDARRHFQFRFDADGKVRFVRFSTEGTIRANFTTNSAYADNAFHSTVATFSNSVGSVIYVDGRLDGTDLDKTDNEQDANVLLGLGARWKDSWATEELKGDISSAAIYTRALSADEVAWLAAEPYCMFARPDRWLRVFDFGSVITRYPAAHRTHVWRNGPITYVGGT